MEIKKEKKINKSVLLISGGIDSFISYKLFKPDISLYIDIGHKYKEQELNVLNDLSIPFKYEKRLFLGDIERNDFIIPLRNLFFISIASFYGDTILMGALKDEINGDKSNYFKNNLNKALNKCYEESYWSEGRKINIKYPLYKWDKSEAIKYYIKKGYSIKDLLKTRSCYCLKDVHCGWCSACIKRFIALKINNIEQEWENNPLESPYIENIKKRISTFSDKRKKDTIKILNL